MVNCSENIVIDSFVPHLRPLSRRDDRIHINKISWNSKITLKPGLDTLRLSIHDENSWDRPRSRFFLRRQCSHRPLAQLMASRIKVRLGRGFKVVLCPCFFYTMS